MKKKKVKKDYSGLINILIVVVFLAIGLFAFISGAPKKEQVKQPQKQQIQKQQPSREVKKQITTYKGDEPRLLPFQKYKFQYTYTINIQGFVKRFEFSMPVPSSEKEKQYISDYKISIKPTQIYKDGSDTMVKYVFENIDNRKIDIVIDGIANLRTYGTKTAKALNTNIEQENDLNRYLNPEPYIESDDSYIKGIAKQINGSCTEEIVQKTYEYIQNNMTYKIEPRITGAKQALKDRYGKCSEYSAIMIAILRAKGIPARLVIGNIARESATQHNWVEVYYDEYGWVTVDPTTRPTNVNIRNKNGELIRREIRFDHNPDNLRYIASGRNKFTTYNVSYSISDRRPGNAQVYEKIKIEKI